MSEELSPELRLLEATIFASGEPVTTEMLARQLGEGADIPALLQELKESYAARGVHLIESDGQWSFRTAPDLAPHMKITRQPRRKLPRAAAEVLAIIAYHQPVTRADIESIRGVETSKGTLDILLELGWVRPGKRRDTPGRPLMWHTTSDFLSHFNLESLKDLPGLDELKAAGLLDARPVMSNLPRESDDDAGIAPSEDDNEFAAWMHDEPDETDIEAAAAGMSPERFVATLIAPMGAVLAAAQIEAATRQFTKSGAQIERTIPLDGGRAVDVFFTGGQGELSDLSFDVLIQPVATRRKKLLIADMESTIIEQEMLDELAEKIGIGPKVAEITRRAMNGELDFAAALTERIGLLKGQPESLLHEVAARMTFTPGARELVAAMKQAGGHCWLVSGGLTYFVEKVAKLAGFDRYFANEVKLEENRLTGGLVMPILDKDAKKRLLGEISATYKCDLTQILAIGDGANDIPMLRACAEGGGLGVAYHAKPKVRDVIRNQINHGDLSALIYAQDLSFSHS